MRRFISLVLIGMLLATYTAPVVHAQDFAEPIRKEESSTPPPDLSGDWYHCYTKGKIDAQELGTGGSFGGGLACGLVLGLIGTGIAVLAQSPSDPPFLFLVQLEDEENACRYTYIDSYRNASVSKKRKSALAGGLFGTIVIVTVILTQ